MMRQEVSVVIGANYGDEGKGLVTDYLCRFRDPTLVVRFNGGAQAGHTVETRCGRRHVFSHIGSGAFNGAHTFLSKHFVTNPLALEQEFKQLRQLDPWTPLSPVIGIDPRSVVTTPWDMALNQVVEQMRGMNRHGTCGMGINETRIRNTHDDFKLTVEDTADSAKLRKFLEEVGEVYVPMRAVELGIEASLVNSYVPKNIKERFISACGLMRAACAIQYWEAFDFTKRRRIVFEGAQGLGLDMNNEDSFPHLTPSNTGMTNVIELLKWAGYDEQIRVYHVTRCYTTRHGQGPLEGEFRLPLKPTMVCKTNEQNQFQGKLRYAPLDLNAMSKNIGKDYQRCMDGCVEIEKNLVVTCADQFEDDEKIPFLVNKHAHFLTVKQITAELCRKISPLNLLVSYGPTRETMWTE